MVSLSYGSVVVIWSVVKGAKPNSSETVVVRTRKLELEVISLFGVVDGSVKRSCGFTYSGGGKAPSKIVAGLT